MSWHYFVYHILGGDGGFWAFIWGGIGSIMLPWCGAFVVYSLHHQCHTKGCYRLGHPNVGGTVKCKKHLKRQ